jgi:hypothetical protein
MWQQSTLVAFCLGLVVLTVFLAVTADRKPGVLRETEATIAARNVGTAARIAELHRELGIDPIYDPGPYLPTPVGMIQEVPREEAEAFWREAMPTMGGMRLKDLPEPVGGLERLLAATRYMREHYGKVMPNGTSLTVTPVQPGRPEWSYRMGLFRCSRCDWTLMAQLALGRESLARHWQDKHASVVVLSLVHLKRPDGETACGDQRDRQWSTPDRSAANCPQCIESDDQFN